jgi:type I restriction enzyme, R subunit
MKFNEQATVENYVIKFLKEKLNYEYIKPKDFEGLRELETEYVINSQLEEAIRRINDVGDEEAKGVARLVRAVDSNQNFLERLRSGFDIVDLQTQRSKNYKIIDFAKPENNTFVVTNQMYFEGNAENIIPDVVVLVNGLPLVLIEAKSPTASENVSYENGIEQIVRYEKNARKIFLPNCFNIATDGIKTVYGATGSPIQYFLEWKDEDREKELGGKLEVTLEALLKPENLLDIVENFIIFEKEKEKLVKKVARYQQLRATNKIVERVKKGDKKRGLIWHTQGSGKSLTMFFTAWKLRFDSRLNNPKVFVLVDRVDLDNQIYDTFVNCGGKNVERATSKEKLLEYVNTPVSGIFVSTIHKFDENIASISNTADNIIVLIDEAHRNQYGDMAINLKKALPNAFMFAFTGTPIDKTKREFGFLLKETPEKYLDYYSIKQAIDDGATLPVMYEARLSKFAIDDKEIDKQFEILTADLNDEEKQVLTLKYSRKEALIKLEKRMKAVVQDIFEHYKAYVEPNGFKAQVVCYDRESVARYKKYFDEIMSPEWSEVVYSQGDRNNTDEELTQYNLSRTEIKDVIEKFKDKKSPLKFLIVCDMLLTGFDAPIEQVMYLDKPLRDHNLLQAIARTNRVYSNKGCGKVIDYYGVTRNLIDSLDFEEKDIDQALTDIAKLKEDFLLTYEQLSKMFEGVNIEDPSMENLRKCLALFNGDEEKKKLFKDLFNKLKIYYEILSPDVFLSEYSRKVGWLACLYVAFRKEYEASSVDVHALISEYGEKLKTMIQDQVDYEGITKNYRPMTVADLVTLEKMYTDENGEEKAKNLEKLLKNEISINIDTHPIFKKFGERLTAIKQEFEQKQIDLAGRIKKYYELLQDVKKKDEEVKTFGLSLNEYALFSASEEFVKADKEVLKEFIRELSEYLKGVLDFQWQESARREEIIKDIKQRLQRMILQDYKGRLDVDKKDFAKYLNRLEDLIIKKF